MNDTLTAVLSTTLISAGVLAELNLLRLIGTDYRERRRAQARRRLRPAARGQSNAPARARAGSRTAFAAALFAGGLTASTVSAQQSAPVPQTSASTDSKSTEAGKSAQMTLGFQPATIANDAPPTVIATDRPSFSDTAGIVPVGRLQLESGYTFTFRNRDGAETQRHNGPELLARVGLLEDRLELRATTSGYVWSRANDSSGSGFDSSEGWSDLALGFKLKLTDQDGALPRLAFEAVTSVGAGSRAISSRRAEPTIKLIWSYDLEKLGGEDWKGFGVYGNFNLAYPTTQGDRFLQGAASICATYAVNDQLGVFAEYYVVGPASKGSQAAHSIDLGAAYLLNNRTQLDARVGFGLNRAADNVYVGLGISYLF